MFHVISDKSMILMSNVRGRKLSTCLNSIVNGVPGDPRRDTNFEDLLGQKGQRYPSKSLIIFSLNNYNY